MRIVKVLLLLLLLTTTAMGKAQTFYICDDNNVSTASEIEFSNNGTTALRGRRHVDADEVRGTESHLLY